MKYLRLSEDKIVCRYFDINRVMEFMLLYSEEIANLYLCYAYDLTFKYVMVKNNEWVSNEVSIPDDVFECKTFNDIPCIYYEMKSGIKGKLYCFDECIAYIDTKYEKSHKNRSLRYSWLRKYFCKSRFGKLDLNYFKNDKENGVNFFENENKLVI